jgi:hypothetical protein
MYEARLAISLLVRCPRALCSPAAPRTNPIIDYRQTTSLIHSGVTLIITNERTDGAD